MSRKAGWVTEWAAGLRFPVLLAVTAALFVVDLLVPDFVPFADEVLLGLITVVLASLRRTGRGSLTKSTPE